jgi:hypothetical protein
MADIDYDLASKIVIEESRKVYDEASLYWDTSKAGKFCKLQHKGFTAIMDAGEINCGGKRAVVAVLFQPGDAIGSNDSLIIEGLSPKWTPRSTVGEAEIYISVGSSINRVWFSGLTSLEALSYRKWDFSQSEGIECYKELTTIRQEFLDRVSKRMFNCRSRRVDFTFDRSKSFGDPHSIGFQDYLQF